MAGRELCGAGVPVFPFLESDRSRPLHFNNTPSIPIVHPEDYLCSVLLFLFALADLNEKRDASSVTPFLIVYDERRSRC